MFNFLKKKELDENIYAPVKGVAVKLEDVPDPIFSEKMMGDGIAVIPNDNIICSPCDGKLTMVADTLHAFGMTMKDGSELIVHIGLDTVNLKGKHFSLIKKEGTNLRHGDPVIIADFDEIRNNHLNPITMIIMNNNEKYRPMNVEGKVSKSDIIIAFSDYES